MNIRCPRCQSQQTSKATVIINAETAIGSTKGIGIGSSFGSGGIAPAIVRYSSTTHMQSILARKLAPPSPPRMAPSAIRVWAIVCSIVAVATLCSTLSTLSTPSTQPAQNGTSVLIIWGIFFGLCLLGLLFSIIHTVRTAPRRKAEYQTNTAHWQHAMQNWHQMYYCHTCDNVYLLHNGAFAPLDNMYGMVFNA